MVYSGHLEELFPIPDFNINYRIGIIETSQAMEQAGCAVGYVGDNYCIVDSVNANGFKIIKLLPDYTRMHLPDGTFGDEDSPFYTFVDAGEYERRGGRKDNNVWHLKVRPGVYQFSHTLPDHNLIDEPFEFATVVWVREPDPMQREV
jgi:hypothetical protein